MDQPAASKSSMTGDRRRRHRPGEAAAPRASVPQYVPSASAALFIRRATSASDRLSRSRCSATNRLNGSSPLTIAPNYYKEATCPASSLPSQHRFKRVSGSFELADGGQFAYGGGSRRSRLPDG